VQDGWNDASGSENGDKCAWTGLKNVTLGSQYFALQPLWSNEANGGTGGCVFTR
jgi:serine protease